MVSDLLKELDIPVFSPVVTMYMSLEQWHASDGLTLDTGWAGRDGRSSKA